MKKKMFENADIYIIKTSNMVFTSEDVVVGDTDPDEWDNPKLID